MDPFRWAYVGSGGIARNTARSITKDDHVIRAVCSRNAATAAAFANKYREESGGSRRAERSCAFGISF